MSTSGPSTTADKPGERGLSADTIAVGISSGHDPNAARSNGQAHSARVVDMWRRVCPSHYLVRASLQRAGNCPVDFAQGVHTVGLLIMLVGLLTALVGYRSPWFVNCLTEFPRRTCAARTPRTYPGLVVAEWTSASANSNGACGHSHSK